MHDNDLNLFLFISLSYSLLLTVWASFGANSMVIYQGDIEELTPSKQSDLGLDKKK